MRMRIAPPSEAVPIIMDAARSPVVGLDTEFADDVPVCRAPLHGLSLAGGSPEDEVVGCFFPYQGHEVAPWAWLRDRVLVPLFGDPRRTIVLHPAKVDLQTLRRRGIPEEAIRARIECTMSMAHVYDENLPKGLKELGGCLLGVRGLESHAETQKRMTRLRRDGAKAVKACLKDIWEVYKEERKRSTEVEARIDPSWPSWRALAMRQPPKLTKGALEARVDPIVRSTIEADYEGRARAVFERYAALDAMLTLGVRYFFVGEIAAKRVPFYAPEVAANLPACLDIETRVCHPLTTEMEENGLKIDLPRLRDIKDAMEAALSALKADVVKAWGFAPDVEVDDSEEDEDSEGFNPGSTDQIVHIVWDVWKLRPPSWALSGGELNPKWVRAKDGMCRVNKEVLDWLASQDGPRSAEIRLLIEWRKFAKLMSGFVVPMDARASADPEHRLHPSTWPVGARTGRYCVARGTPVEILRDVRERPTVAVEDVRPGDLAYAYDSDRRLVLRRVVWSGKTGTLPVVRIHWRGTGRRHTGHVDVTGNHEVRLVDGSYVRADALRPGDRVLAVHRGMGGPYARLWASNEGEIPREHRWAYAAVNGPVPDDHHVHHRDGNKLNNTIDNLESVLGRDHTSMHAHEMWGDPERRRQKAAEMRAAWAAGRMTPTPSGPTHPSYVPLDPAWLEAVLWEHGGRPTAFRDAYGLDYASTMRKVRAAGIDWRRIKLMHRPDGSFISRDDVVRARSMAQPEALRALGKNYYSFRKLQEAYGLDPWNHVVEHVDPLPGVVDVYDIEVEEAHNFIAGELCVHNSQSQPNCENIPRPSSMPKLPIPPGADPTKPPPGVNAEKDKKTGEVKGWRVGSLRAVFIPAPGWSLVSLDLAQVENRLVAHESGDETMYDLFTLWDCYECKGSGRTTEPLHACPKCGAPDGKRDKLKPEQPAVRGFCLGKDIHSASGVALGLFDAYGPEEGRQRGKTFNHAASYGMGARTLSRREKFNQKDAERGLEAWHARYPRVRELHARITGEIRERGYVQMWDGHVRRFYAARILERSNNLNHWEWEGIIREAVNVLAQGGTAAIMKRAMLATREKLRSHEDSNMRKTRLCNQVHDEAVYEAPTLVAKEVRKLAAWELEHAARLRVPIIAEGGEGPNWEKAHA